MRHPAFAAWITLIAASRAALPAVVFGVRFDPPRVYLTHANLNRSGTLSALRGQDNFLSLYMPPVDNAQGLYTPEGFSVVLLLPGSLEILDQEEQGLIVTAVQHDGQPYWRVSQGLDPEAIKSRCFDNTWGVYDAGSLWYRIKDGAKLPDEPQLVRATLRHGEGKFFHTRCFFAYCLRLSGNKGTDGNNKNNKAQ